MDQTSLPDNDSGWHWQLHAVKISRKLVFVAMEHETRYAMVFWGLKKGDGETLINLFFERLVNHLLLLTQISTIVDDSHAHKLVGNLLEANRAFNFQPGSDRSVQTHINEVVHMCRYDVSDHGSLPDNRAEAAGFEAKLNQTLRSVRGGKYFQPDEALLLKALRLFAGFDAYQLRQVSASLQVVRRQRWASLMQDAEASDATEGSSPSLLKRSSTMH
ncbi:hypothetical protein LZ005_04025 [Massilia sp. TS11]|nr:hypothetical protein [Massilia sp. TS11]MCG2583513.1 hypothetical protein [Massilia sp. TS11]